MNERISRVLKKMEEKGITQLIVSDPLSIRFLTGIMVNPGERLYALILRTSGKHTMLLNYLYFVKDTGLLTRLIHPYLLASTKPGRHASSSRFRRSCQSLRLYGALTV